MLRKHGYPPEDREGAVLTVLEQASVVCREWRTEGLPSRVPMAAEPAVAYEHSPAPEYAPAVHKVMRGLWLEVRNLVEEPGLQAILQTLFEADITAPEPGYEVMAGNRVAAELELAWPSARVAVALPDQVENTTTAHLEGAGWTVFTFPFLIDELLRTLR